MLRWIKCLLGRHEGDGRAYPWNCSLYVAVSRCRHCGAIVTHAMDQDTFEALFYPPEVRRARR